MSRKSSDISRTELIAMISVLRGQLYDYRYLLLDRPAGHSDAELLAILDATSFNIDDADRPSDAERNQVRGIQP